jgi:hypothetical protein
MKKINDYFDKNYFKIAANMKIYNKSRDEGRRGVYFLPQKIQNKQFYNKPSLNYLHNNLGFHWFCLNFNGIYHKFKTFI